MGEGRVASRALEPPPPSSVAARQGPRSAVRAGPGAQSVASSNGRILDALSKSPCFRAFLRFLASFEFKGLFLVGRKGRSPCVSVSTGAVEAKPAAWTTVGPVLVTGSRPLLPLAAGTGPVASVDVDMGLVVVGSGTRPVARATADWGPSILAAGSRPVAGVGEALGLLGLAAGARPVASVDVGVKLVVRAPGARPVARATAGWGPSILAAGTRPVAREGVALGLLVLAAGTRPVASVDTGMGPVDLAAGTRPVARATGVAPAASVVKTSMGPQDVDSRPPPGYQNSPIE